MVVKSKKDKEEIKKLKKKLKELSKKYLNQRKKRVKDPNLYKRIQEDTNRKINTVSSLADINKLMMLLRGQMPPTQPSLKQRLENQPKQEKPKQEKPKQEKPKQEETPPPPYKKKEEKPKLTPQEQEEKEEKARKDIAKNYIKLRNNLRSLNEKYNNETLTFEDLQETYNVGKDFGSSASTAVQTITALKAGVNGVRGAYNYFVRLLNRNRPANQNVYDPAQQQPPPQQPPQEPPQQPPQEPPPPPIDEPRVVQPPREDTESYLRRGLNVITNPVVGAGLLGVGVHYLTGLQRLRQLREQRNRREEDTQTETVEPTQQLREAQSMISNLRRERQARNSFRYRTQSTQTRQDTGLQTTVSEELRGFRDSSIASPSRETMDRIIGNTEQGRLEDRMDRLGRSQSENERIDAEQRQYEEEMTQQQLAENQEQQQPQME